MSSNAGFGATPATIIAAGAVATVAFDIFGQALSPMLGFPALAPIPLATQTWKIFLGDALAGPGGHLLHYAAGVLAYPIGWFFIWKPIFGRTLPWFLSATVYGIGLWVFALYGMAHLVAGNPPFLGFTGITWVALVGHIVFAWVIALVDRMR